ncbi:MAG: TolC family protein [Flavobacteriales bacterium]|nr:TolC family protein [Flavobacteriales bacterium]MDW8409661.1 TolC family protein [Flavobacteriales bacterium]
MKRIFAKIRPEEIYLVVSLVPFLWVYSIWSQSDTSFPKRKINYSEYIHTIAEKNFSFLAEKFNVPLSEAGVLTAGIRPDPEIGFGYFDNNQRRLNMGNGFTSELAWTLELGGKRKARLDLAQSEVLLNRYLLADFWRNLRADATIQYLQALQRRRILEVLYNSYFTMKRLAETDSLRYRLGAINEVDARQSRLEAGALLNEVYQAEADWKSTLSQLAVFMGRPQSDTLLIPEGSFDPFDRQFTLPELLTTALSQRADLKAALQNKTVAEKYLQVVRSLRIPDLGLSLSNTYASYTRNVIAPTPSFYQVAVGISVPLKFSNNRPGELKAAFLTTQQMEARYHQAEIEIQSEVTQAFFKYQALRKQVQQFNTGLLAEAKAILEGKIYSYQRGETNLLEVLNAQRTYNDLQLTYYQTLFDFASALVELERAAGFWDINF